MQRRAIRLSEGLGVALLFLLAISVTLLLGILLSVNDAPLLDEGEDALLLATDTPFWVAGGGVIITATPSPTTDETVPTLASTAVPAENGDETPIPIPTAEPTGENCGVIPPGWQSYVVQTGDTLMKLAVQSGATAAEIVRVNCLTAPVLYVGTVLYVPAQTPTRVPCGPPSWWARYLVQSGDTLYSLALRTGTTVYQIMNANCMVGTQLTAGRYIYLPPTAVVSATPTPLPPTTPLPSLTPTPRPPTATPEPTETPLPATSTATATTPPATATSTPTGTASPTPTETVTSTPQPPTVEPTRTATPTLIPSLTPSATAVSPTPTMTPSATPPAPTATATATPTGTPTLAPPTATATATPTPTMTPTLELPTVTATATPTP